MAHDILGLARVDGSMVGLVGGKGAALGELSRMDGIAVPPGFVVTTNAFRRVLDGAAVDTFVDALGQAAPGDRATIARLSGAIRGRIEAVPIPDDLAAAISAEVATAGERVVWAVRSSATAEDQPGTSFAGQHDTELGVVGGEAILASIRRCWASLFTDRAVMYRLRAGLDARSVAMAVVVQHLIPAGVAGTLFTADPATGNRTVASVEAVPGLGEALVSGHANPDVFKVRDGQVIARGGSGDSRPTLSDAEVVRLVELGRRIEARFGRPQDIEWCLTDGELWFVQSRPITTLFPIPDAPDDRPRVYLSVGHQQMMTDPMKPLGLSFWQMTTPRPMAEAGGRLFVDVTGLLASPASRGPFLEMAGRSDPLIAAALQTVIDRPGFLPPVAESPSAPQPAGSVSLATDPAIVAELIADNEASVAALERDIAGRSGSDLLDFIESDIAELRRLLFDRRSHEVFTSAMDATAWLNEHLERWLGEKNVADTLSLSVPNNVTSEMGLDLIRVADVIRPHREVVALLEDYADDDLLDRLPAIPGGSEARDAIGAFLDRYGMRCPGEIDITRPRWSERPTMLVPLILSEIRSFEPGEGERRFERGREEAAAKAADVLARLRALPDGASKAAEAQAKIERVRTFIGYREYPKYGMVRRYFVYKRALLAESERLVAAGRLGHVEDIFFLRFDELRNVVRSGSADAELIRSRNDAVRSFESLRPPRVLTSEGEGIEGTYRRHGVGANVLIGLPVSAGTVEGRARVVRSMADADLAPGDILVTTFTDPSWTPLFLAIAGLVTEVGGVMTHGAVIAREYGLPAVVGVHRATERIRDGQRIRVDATNGEIELLA
jgi:pyruvate,water dikinase